MIMLMMMMNMYRFKVKKNFKMIKGINLEEIDNTFNFKDNKHYLYFCKFKFCRDFYVFLV